jgi:hypothetical protein
MAANKSKPRGLYYSDKETRNRVARSGGVARAQKYAQMRARQQAH